MTDKKVKTWHLNRQINFSVLFQLVLLASLIVGSWFNLQRQLDLLRYDVTSLLDCNEQFHQKLELLWGQSIANEYRLRALEKALSEAGLPEKTY